MVAAGIARRAGDKAWLRALASAAYEKGWPRVIQAYLADRPDVADALVAAGMLPAAVAEAWALTLPVDDGPEFQRFARLVGLHDPPDRWGLRGAA